MNNHLSEALNTVSARDLLREGRHHDIGGRLAEAMDCYAAAIELTRDGSDPRLQAEGLRRLGVLHHLRSEPEIARDLCQRSWDLALKGGADDLAADACNALAGFALERGDLEEAVEKCRYALRLAGETPTLVAKIEQNLGIIANIRGQWTEALKHYRCSLAAYEAIQDERGCAIAHHNLGLIHADRKQWMEADRHYRTSKAFAEAAGDHHLKGLVALNRAEVRLAVDDIAGARAESEQALRAFQKIDARRDISGAHRMLGMVFKRLGRPAMAESHLRSALEIAANASCPLSEADAAKELAGLYRIQGRHEDAIARLKQARKLYEKLQAASDLSEIDEQIADINHCRRAHA
ncbi:MAG TPA: tetratricopeptide repeat protein [Gemmatimonadales bacterium]|nr:tetratricopeptide repeat protein [Gemmatimonadales bacterium]